SFPPAPLSAPAAGCGHRGLDLPVARGAPAVGAAQVVVRAGQGEGEPAAVPLDYLPGAGAPSPCPGAQAQAPPPGLQALAARGAEAAVAAGGYRVGVPCRRHRAEADLRPG